MPSKEGNVIYIFFLIDSFVFRLDKAASQFFLDAVGVCF